MRGFDERPAIKSARKSGDSGGAIGCGAVKGSPAIVIAKAAQSLRQLRAIDSLWIACESDSSELPPFFRLKEIAVSRPNVSARRGARAAAQNALVAHELTIVFAEGAGRSVITGIGGIGASRPLPSVAEELVKTLTLRKFLP